MSVKKNKEVEISPQEQSAIDHQYQLDHQIVKGVFRNLIQKGSPLRFPFRKYKKDAIKFYPLDINGKPNYFIDGQTYEIPLMIANHLNNRCNRYVNRVVMNNGKYGQQHQRDSYGNFIYEAPVETIEKRPRFAFINTDFRPVKGWEEPSQIIQAKIIT